MPQYTNEILFGRAEPGVGNYEAVYSSEFASAFPNGDTSAFVELSAIKYIQRFANIVSLSSVSKATAIVQAITGIDGLPPETNT